MTRRGASSDLGRIVGVTCYGSRHLAIEAADQGADYVAFGGFYPSTTKTGGKFRSDPEILRWWSETMTVPCCAIGGITPGNCGPLVAAGADFLAVIAAVWDHPEGPGAGVKSFLAAIAAAAYKHPLERVRIILYNAYYRDVRARGIGENTMYGFCKTKPIPTPFRPLFSPSPRRGEGRVRGATTGALPLTAPSGVPVAASDPKCRNSDREPRDYASSFRYYNAITIG